MGGCSKAVELYWIGMGAALERCSVDGGVTLPGILIAVVWSIAALRLWFCGAEIYAAPNAAFNISGGVTRLAVHMWLN